MRSPLDRLRHAILFETLALILVIPLGALVFGVPLNDFGVVGVATATVATLWTIFYNWLFDVGLMRFGGTTLKTPSQRVLHAVLLEVGLMLVLTPIIAWYLGIGLWPAFTMDLAITLFYMGFALVFNWGYDRVFPLAEWSR